MDSFMLSVLQRFSSYVDVFLNRTRQRTYGRPRYGFGNFYYGIEITGTRYWKTCLDNINAQLFQLLGHLYLLYGVKLASWYLFTVPQCCVENK